MIEGISAVTLATHDMSRAVLFYRMLGFEMLYGGGDAAFTSFRAGTSYVNLIAQPSEQNWSWWGRVIFYHSDVDSLHASVIAAGYRPDTAPRAGELELPLDRQAHPSQGGRAARDRPRPLQRRFQRRGPGLRGNAALSAPARAHHRHRCCASQSDAGGAWRVHRR